MPSCTKFLLASAHAARGYRVKLQRP